MEEAAEPALATRRLPARARDRLRDQLDEITGYGGDAELEEDAIPPNDGNSSRVWWIAERLSLGLWRTAHVPMLSRAWGVSEQTVRNDAKSAALFTQMLTGDVDKLVQWSAQNVARFAAMGDDPRVRLEASKILLQLTGHLKGGAEHGNPSAAEIHAGVLKSIREPGPDMIAILREAFADPSDELRSLLAEFAVVTTEGAER